MVTLQSVQGHTGLTHCFYFFLIFGALWRSGLRARVPECQKLKGWVRQVWRWTLWWTHFWHSQKNVAM